MPKSATKWRLLQSAALIKRTCPASPILGRFHFSAVTPTLRPKSFLPPPVFGCTRDSRVSRAFISWGSGKAWAPQEASCVPAALGGDIPTSDRPFLCPAGVSRAPGLLGSRCPETHLGVAFAPQVWFFALILRFLPSPSRTLSPGEVSSAGD